MCNFTMLSLATAYSHPWKCFLKMFFFSTANAHFSYLALRINNLAMHQCLFILSISHCAPPLNYFNGDQNNWKCKWRPMEIVLNLFISI